MRTCPNCATESGSDIEICPQCGWSLIEPANLASLQTIGVMQTQEQPTFSGVSSLHPADLNLESGQRFAGRYEIDQFVGRGGMGQIYRAKDTLTGDMVALKLIRTDRTGGPDAVRRLIDEAIITRRIRHRNIVSVYDVGEVDGQVFMCMEWLDGVSLRDWHKQTVGRQEEVSFDQARRIVLELLDGLKEAHRNGVIHRDLKPENIMLLAEPTAQSAELKILDFGIARAAGSSVESGSGSALGTPRYMAPEQITNPGAAGPRADIYSLSVIFYELLVDVLPQGHWQPPSDGRTDVPEAVDELIRTGLSNRPANRPATAEDYLSRLQRAADPVREVESDPNPGATPPPLPLPENAARKPEPVKADPPPESTQIYDPLAPLARDFAEESDGEDIMFVGTNPTAGHALYEARWMLEHRLDPRSVISIGGSDDRRIRVIAALDQMCEKFDFKTDIFEGGVLLRNGTKYSQWSQDIGAYLDEMPSNARILEPELHERVRKWERKNWWLGWSGVFVVLFILLGKVISYLSGAG